MHVARDRDHWDHTTALICAWTGAPFHKVHPYAAPPEQSPHQFRSWARNLRHIGKTSKKPFKAIQPQQPGQR